MLVYLPTYLVLWLFVNEHCSTQIEDLQRRKWIHLDLEGRLVYCVTLDVESSSVNPWMSVLIKVRKRLTHWLKLAGFQINTLASQQRPALPAVRLRGSLISNLRKGQFDSRPVRHFPGILHPSEISLFVQYRGQINLSSRKIFRRHKA